MLLLLIFTFCYFKIQFIKHYEINRTDCVGLCILQKTII
jgi:hypothetical protein